MKHKSVIISSLGAFALLAGTLSAAPVAVWDGPGPRACMGRCSVEWALTQLSPDQHSAVIAAMEAAPLGYSIPVQDGATFTMMSYFDQTPHADMRTTVAALNGIEPANGWQFDGWSFVKIAGCQNWAVMTDVPPVGSVFGPQSGSSPVATDVAPITPTSATTGTSATPVSMPTPGSTAPSGGTPSAALTSSDEPFFSGTMDTPMMMDLTDIKTGISPVLPITPTGSNTASGPTTSAGLNTPPGSNGPFVPNTSLGLNTPPGSNTSPPAPVPLPPALFLLLTSLLTLGFWRRVTSKRQPATAITN